MMERLTFDGNFCDIAQCRESPCPYNGSCTQREVWERLKAYEDTGLSPKGLEHAAEIENGLNSDGYSIARMVELMNADKDGRVVVLPCKVGDTIFFISKVRKSHFKDDKIIIDDEGKWKIYKMPFALVHFPYIGKSYFRTREEAEKALEAMQNGTVL